MLKNFTALYVEDEKELSKVVYSFFINIFKDIILAENGEEGLKKYKENKHNIDIIITDINMPKLNGLDMCRKIRELDYDIPIVITTAHSDASHLYEAIDLGVSKFVSKPLNIRKLLDILKSSLEPLILKQALELEQKQNLEQMVINAKFSATGKLAAGITHEINTPLTYVKANVEMIGYDIENLNDETIKKDIQISLEKVKDGINRIANIVNTMKDISVQKTTEKENFNIYSTIVTAATLAWNKLKHSTNFYINGTKFDINTDKNLLTFNANIDVQRIEQVWVIIINNAIDELIKIKNFNDRKFFVDISEDEKYIFVIFKDNAGGIDKDIIEHIFEPFKGSKNSSGMGVGLSIAQKIINDQNNGTIEAYNEDDGAVFKITLPLS